MTLEGSKPASNSIERFFLKHGVVLKAAPAAPANWAILMQFCKAKVVIVETLVLTDVLVDVNVTVGIGESKDFFGWLNIKNLRSLLCRWFVL